MGRDLTLTHEYRKITIYLRYAEMLHCKISSICLLLSFTFVSAYLFSALRGAEARSYGHGRELPH